MDFSALTGGYGAAHCTTQVLYREIISPSSNDLFDPSYPIDRFTFCHGRQFSGSEQAAPSPCLFVRWLRFLKMELYPSFQRKMGGIPLFLKERSIHLLSCEDMYWMTAFLYLSRSPKFLWRMETTIVGSIVSYWWTTTLLNVAIKLLFFGRCHLESS